MEPETGFPEPGVDHFDCLEVLQECLGNGTLADCGPDGAEEDGFPEVERQGAVGR